MRVEILDPADRQRHDTGRDNGLSLGTFAHRGVTSQIVIALWASHLWVGGQVGLGSALPHSGHTADSPIG